MIRTGTQGCRSPGPGTRELNYGNTKAGEIYSYPAGVLYITRSAYATKLQTRRIFVRYADLVVYKNVGGIRVEKSAGTREVRDSAPVQHPSRRNRLGALSPRKCCA